MALVIKTDNKWRNILHGFELPKKWRKEFNYMSEEDFNNGAFISYGRQIYSFDEFERASGELRAKGWDGVKHDSFFSGLVMKVSRNEEEYMIGRFTS